MYVDSHAHILNEFYNSLDEVIDNAKKNNVLKIINCAEDIKTSYEVIKLSNTYKGVIYPAIGVHPENVSTFTKEDLMTLEDLITKNKIIAIGEIGLDYYYGKENIEKQKEIFKAQLELAQKYDIPVIIHSRESTKDTIDTLKEYNVKGVIHCFSGSVETANEYIKMGYKLGINGIATFKNSKKIKDVIRKINLENFILETDCPFLTPEPFRKYKNEPKYIPTIAKYLSELLNKELDEIMNITTKNVFSVFDIN